MLTSELSSIVLAIPNDAYTSLSQNLIGCSTLSQKNASWLVDIRKLWEGNFVSYQQGRCSLFGFITLSVFSCCRDSFISSKVMAGFTRWPSGFLFDVDYHEYLKSTWRLAVVTTKIVSFCTSVFGVSSVQTLSLILVTTFPTIWYMQIICFGDGSTLNEIEKKK